MIGTLLDRLSTKREPKIAIKERGVYSTREAEAVYNDNTQQYEVETHKGRAINVSSVDSFIDFIREELSRLNNADGNFSTVTINPQGGYFTADDNFTDIVCKYERSLTKAWETLSEVAGQEISHERLLTVLQRLRPFIPGFEKLYMNLLDIRTIGRSEMISNPVYIAGEDGFSANSGYKITYKLQNGTQEESTLPSCFTIVLPWSKGRQDLEYEVPVELMFLNNGNGTIRILFQCAELEQIEERALQEEVDYLKEKLKEFKKLLVLLNY